MKQAIIDISSSSISMTVIEDGNPLIHCRESCSMLYYMEGKTLSERGVEKLVGILSGWKEECRRLAVDEAYLISTAGMRAVANFDQVAKRVKKQTGFAINLIDGKTEAYCDYIANRKLVNEDTVLIDIGGLSVELCDCSHAEKEGLLSLNIGPMKLNRKFVDAIQPDREEAKEIKAYVKKKLNEAEVPDREFACAVLVGPMSLAIYEVYAEYFKTDLNAAQKKIEYLSLKKLSKYLVGSSDRSAFLLKTAPERVHFLSSAMLLLCILLKRFNVTSILVSDRGVKEGFAELVSNGALQAERSSLQNTKPVRQKSNKVVEKARASRTKKAASSEQPEEGTV